MKRDEEEQANMGLPPGSTSAEPAAISRREWLARVSGAALAAGLPAAAQADSSEAAAQEPAALPPGLYAPSGECLGRALESDQLFHPVPPGSATDYVRPLPGPFQPAFFSPDQFATVRRLVEIILGLPQAQGEAVAQWVDFRVASAARVRNAARQLSAPHRAVAVAYYGAPAVERLENDEPEAICRAGLAWVERESQRARGASFAALVESQQVELVEVMSSAQGGENDGTRFFAFLKREALNGYYTSPEGLKELNCQENKFHAESPGCNLG